ncbi:hypothetical protein L228DRAFT_134334 [Xylona heveae TC161]|uniref:F-box domain-containing protein n=1 Tax=Xylona heveae (strain CBS 132557 / TC161) TaxID=1328760 RepID=A0A165GX15_XYLHT|nr:hypothetical protein L228DRAFT_134334 [Xylona heveae TC161]KZF22709.1 hypothetical protein L228DRAFT_134334 [Xylona heveae TC161]
MLLLNLPAELLEHILYFLAPDAFYLILFVCRHLRHLASGSQPLLLHQLSRISPFKSPLLQGSNDRDALFATFQALARHHLLGVDVLAQPQILAITERLNVSETLFLSSGSSLKTAICLKGTAEVYLYELRSSHTPKFLGGMKYENGLIDRAPYGDPDGSYDLKGARWEVTRMAFANNPASKSKHHSNSSDLLCVLYEKTQPFNPKSHKRYSPFDQGHREAVKHYRLVAYDITLCRSSTDSEYQGTIRWERNISMRDGHEPLALAISRRGIAAISWRYLWRAQISRVFLYTLTDPSEGPEELRAHPGLIPPGLTARLEFVMDSSRLNLYPQRFPIFESFCGACKPADIQRGFCTLTMNALAGEFDLQVGMPFAGIHKHSVSTGSGSGTIGGTIGGGLCRDLCLMLGFKWTARGPAAFLVRGVRSTTSSNPAVPPEAHQVNLNRPGDEWNFRPVSRLRKFVQGSSSLGTIMITSPQGTRIAMSYWAAQRSCVLIWTLTPQDILQVVTKPPVSNCPYPDFIPLDPVLLRVDAAVHRLHFHDEYSLWAASDRGLVYWDLKPDLFSPKPLRQMAIRSRN